VDRRLGDDRDRRHGMAFLLPGVYGVTAEVNDQ
jgi:hypothetical protein